MRLHTLFGLLASAHGCGVTVDPFLTRSQGTAAAPSYQLWINIPDEWAAGTEVTVGLNPGASMLERCWAASRSLSSTAACVSVTSITLTKDSPVAIA